MVHWKTKPKAMDGTGSAAVAPFWGRNIDWKIWL